MLARVLRYFATGPDRPPLSDDPAVIRRVYERRRWSVMLSVTLGYGLFYVCRVNFSVVKKPLIDAGILTAQQMGFIGSAMLVTYAVGKLINGFLTDRSNIRRFMSTALLASAAVNLVLGWRVPFIVFVGMWGINGWFQSVGSAPSAASLSQWFSARERGTRYGIWSCSHGIGEAFTFAVTAVLVATYGWRWGFWGPGLLGLAAGLVLTRTLADRPETYGLPAVHVYRGEPAPAGKPAEAVGSAQREVLRHPAIWVIGLSSAAMYVTRYGLDHWGVLYLQEAKGYSLQQAGSLLAISPIAQVVGMSVSGLVSDRVFRSRRHPQALIAAILQIAALWLLWKAPPGSRALTIVAIALIGLALGNLLVFLGGLMAIDLCSQRATGAAMGLVGLFSYLGAAIQDAVSGMLLEAGKQVVDGVTTHSFDAVIRFWLAASVLSMVLAASTWKAKRRGDAVS